MKISANGANTDASYRQLIWGSNNFVVTYSKQDVTYG
jgi:hypothetical protein